MNASLLMIDNYDSFTYNLVQMFRAYPLSISVCRSDAITIDDVETQSPDYIVISPGPGSPASAGISVAVVEHFYSRIPILGVCLGMQCINEAFGGSTVQAALPIHGKTSILRHCRKGIFRNVAQSSTAARYHSLAVADIHDDLEVTATTRDGTVMGLSHQNGLLHGVQFHPESFLTEQGSIIIRNFLYCGPLQEYCA